MGFARAWRQGGDVPLSAGVGRRGARVSPSCCRPSTALAPESRRFPRSHRLTREAELQAVRREGKRIRTGVLEVRILASPLRHSRVGLIVPKYRHGSVERNRVKRRLRELARLELLPALARAQSAGGGEQAPGQAGGHAAGGHAMDAVIRALPTAYDATFDRLALDMARVVRELPRLVRQLPSPAPAPSGASSTVVPPTEPIEAREEDSR